MPTTIDSLPAPEILETIDFETLLESMKDYLQNNLPEWTGRDIESDPINKVLEVFSYRETLLRQRINEAAQANLLNFATSGDLEQLSVFYGIERQTDETDSELRARTITHIKGFSVGGTADAYKAKVLSVSSNIRDISLDSPEQGKVRITVLSKDGDGAPEQTLLDSITEKVNADDVKIITDTIEVRGAEIITVNINVLLHLYPDTPDEVLDKAREDFPILFNSARGMGWNLTKSWIVRRLHLEGVQEVEIMEPTENINVDEFQSVALGTVNIAMGERKW
jgi:phage-related baseplate assembly protein